MTDGGLRYPDDSSVERAAASGVRAQKEALRARMRALLAGMEPAAIRAAGDAAADRAGLIPAFRAARRIAVYLALPREMPTRPLIERCWREGRAVVVPAFDAKNPTYRPAVFESQTPLRRGALGVMEPETPEWVEPWKIDVWVVPGLAFSITGERLGRGSGWYDRMLSSVCAPRIGWALDLQVLERVPFEAGDIPVNWVVTERRVMNCACRNDNRREQ